MKKLLALSLFLSFTVGAQTLESHIGDTVKPLAKLLEGKQGKVVIGVFHSAKSSDKCEPSKAVNSKVSAALTRIGVKTSLSSRPVNMNSDQAEISRVTKLSGGSYIILGSYEVSGTKFKLDCTLYDHNGAGVGACDEVVSVTIPQEQVDSINCPKSDKPVKEVKPLPQTDNEEASSLPLK